MNQLSVYKCESLIKAVSVLRSPRPSIAVVPTEFSTIEDPRSYVVLGPTACRLDASLVRAGFILRDTTCGFMLLLGGGSVAEVISRILKSPDITSRFNVVLI